MHTHTNTHTHTHTHTYMHTYSTCPSTSLWLTVLSTLPSDWLECLTADRQQTDWLTDSLIGWRTHCLTDWLNDSLTHSLSNWLFGQLTGTFADWLIHKLLVLLFHRLTRKVRIFTPVYTRRVCMWCVRMRVNNETSASCTFQGCSNGWVHKGIFDCTVTKTGLKCRHYRSRLQHAYC